MQGGGSSRQERRKWRRCSSIETSLQGCKDQTHISSRDLPLSRSVTGGFVGGEMDAGAEATLKGDGEVQGEELPP